MRVSGRLTASPRLRWSGLAVSLVVLLLILAACSPAATPVPAAEPAAAAQPTATSAPEAEPTATAAPEAEPTATPQAEAEPTATAVAEEEAMTFTGDPEAGSYIATLTGGCGCHFNRELGGLAGGNGFADNTVFAANITPDMETGIGGLSENQIVSLLRTGAGDGYQLHPAMPYRAFSALSQKEALDIAAYLHSLDPIPNAVPARTLATEPEPFTPDPALDVPPTDPVARGEQLVALARCGSCHTPQGDDGSMMLAGATVRDSIASNITPDEETGIGKWTVEEIAALLRTGTRPDGSAVEGAMAQQIDRRFNILTEADALAIAEYLKSIPAVSHNPYE